MKLLSQMSKYIFEEKAGRIHFISGGWSYTPTSSELKKTFKINPILSKHYSNRVDLDGKKMVLICKRFVICPSKSIGNGSYPHIRGGWSVPMVVCRKCGFYRKSDRKYRFARCLFKSSKNAYVEAAIETINLASGAFSKANKFMEDTVK